MKKRFLPILFLVIYSTYSYSQKQLREFVVIVRPVYHESTTEFLKKFSDNLKKDGYINASEYLKTYSEGKGFGSGFIVKADNGKSYILTNRHVVMQAETANIEFSNTDGSKVYYSNCKIVDIDETNDLALLAFPDDAVVNRALNFSTNTVEDGKEVFSAGFPGMGGKPSWQLGKGIVSNSAFSMETLDEDIKTIVIQHTAQIDRGSSGSPLLIADSNELTGFSVVGLNTWKVFNRENVNLTIPVSLIKKFITKAISSEKLDNNGLLEKNSREFVSDAMHGFKKVLKYVSYNYVSKISVEKFYSYWKNSSKDAKDDILDVFANGHPIEAVRIAIADAIAQSIEKDKNTFAFESISGLASYETPTTVTLSLKFKPVTSSWIIEQNGWRINSLSCLKTGDSDNYGIAQDFNFFMKVTPQLYISTSEAEKIGYGVDISSGDKLFYSLSLFNYSHFACNEEYMGNDVYKKTSEGYVNYKEFSVNIGYQYPFQLAKIYLIPFVKAGAGINFGDVFSFSSTFHYGLQTAYKLKQNKFIVFHLEIAPRILKQDDFSENNSDIFNTLLYTNEKFGGFNIGVGYTF